MSAADPGELIGKVEDAYLEFKAKEALLSAGNIAREVVAFLNADGGDIWIGIREQDGVATFVDPIPNALSQRDALWNHLLDTIEPAPSNAEATVSLVPTASGGEVLLLSVKRGMRRPYALIKNRGRHFLLRAGARIREMSRGEIEEAFKDGKGGAVHRDTAIEETITKTTREIDEQRSTDSFWWTIAPVPSLNVDFENMTEGDKQFCRELLTEPTASGNRRTGWTMVFDGSNPRIRTNGILHSFGDPPRRHEIKVTPTGKMTFVAPRVRLDRNWRSDSLEIFPFALIELPVSSFRIAAKFLEHFGPLPPSKLIVAAVIGRMQSARLQPGSPSEPHLPWKQAGGFDGHDLVVLPFEVDGEHFFQKPDAAAYGLVLRIYEQFDLDAADIPLEFSPSDRMLRIGRS